MEPKGSVLSRSHCNHHQTTSKCTYLTPLHFSTAKWWSSGECSPVNKFSQSSGEELENIFAARFHILTPALLTTLFCPLYYIICGIIILFLALFTKPRLGF